MANIKTITLNGTERAINIAGQNCDIRNDGADIIYASSHPNITAGTDGVLAIPIGQAAKLLDCRGTVYLFGTGIVQLCGNDYSDLVFKTAATSSGEGGEDTVARNSINAHVMNSGIHLTLEDAINAVTTTISNPNLLTNPDFSINQRGKESWSLSGQQQVYTVDRWYAAKCIVNKLGGGGISLAWNGTDGDSGWIQQKIPTTELFGKVVTISADLDGERHSVTATVPTTADKTVGGAANEDGSILFAVSNHGNNLMSVVVFSKVTTPITIENIKLELGSQATPFLPPEPAMELSKCQRYYYSSYQNVPAGTPDAHNNELVLHAIDSTHFNITTLNFPMTMRAIPSVRFFNPQTGDEGCATNSEHYDNTAVIHAVVNGSDRVMIESENLTVGDNYCLHYIAGADL